MNFFCNWKEQNLIGREKIIDILQTRLKVAPHPLPPGTIGQLYVVDGVAQAADAIMDFLEERAIYEKEKAQKLIEEAK